MSIPDGNTSLMEGHIKSWQSYKSMAPGRWGSLKCEPSAMLLFQYLSPPKRVLFFFGIAPIHHPHPSTSWTALKLETIIETETRWSSCWSPRPSRHAKLKEILVSKVSGGNISSPWYSIELCVSKKFQEKRGQSVCWILLIAMSIPN